MHHNRIALRVVPQPRQNRGPDCPWASPSLAVDSRGARSATPVPINSRRFTLPPSCVWWRPNLNVERCSAGLREDAEKATDDVILRRQQAPKNLHLLENTECKSFAPKTGAQDDGGAAFIRNLLARHVLNVHRSRARLQPGATSILSAPCRQNPAGSILQISSLGVLVLAWVVHEPRGAGVTFFFSPSVRAFSLSIRTKPSSETPFCHDLRQLRGKSRGPQKRRFAVRFVIPRGKSVRRL